MIVPKLEHGNAHCLQQLAANPLKGKDCGEIRSGYRTMNAGSHVIFYRPKRL